MAARLLMVGKGEQNAGEGGSQVPVHVLTGFAWENGVDQSDSSAGRKYLIRDMPTGLGVVLHVDEIIVGIFDALRVAVFPEDGLR